MSMLDLLRSKSPKDEVGETGETTHTPENDSPPVESSLFAGFETNKEGKPVRPAPTGPHLLWLSGTGSGKTRKGLVPQICTWNGPVFAVSAKGDLAEYSAAIRSQRGGPIYVMDNTGQVDWSQLPDDVIPVINDPCALLTKDADGSTDDSALELAELLVDVSTISSGKGSGGGDGAFWAKLATGTLACLLQAGAGYPDPVTGEWVDGGGIAWVRKAALNPGEEEDDDPEEIDLDTPSWDVAANRVALIDSDHYAEVDATKQLDPKQRDSVGINLRVALSSWSKRAVRGKPGARPFAPEMLAEPSATFYLVSPSRGSAAAAASSVVESLVAHWTLHAMTKRLPKIAMVIDECPQICPLPHLSEHIGLMRSYGMHFLVAAQTGSQFEDKFGKAKKDVLMDVFPSILVGVGFGTVEKELIERAAWAEKPTEVQKTSWDDHGKKSFTVERADTHGSELLPDHPGEAQLLYRGRSSMMVKLVDYSEM